MLDDDGLRAMEESIAALLATVGPEDACVKPASGCGAASGDTQ